MSLSPKPPSRLGFSRYPSAAFGYRLGCPVAIALLKCSEFELENDTKVVVDMADELVHGRVRQGAMFDSDGNRMRPLRS